MEQWRAELRHHGIKGMRWGIRRYQNKDGSLTEAGKKRKQQVYDDVNSFAESRRKYNQAMRDDYESAVNAGKKGIEAGNEALKVYDRFANRRKKSVDLSNVSDKELQQRINRLNMEQQYHRLTASNETSKGRQFAEDVLSVGGSALAIGSSALTIALTVKQLRGR